MFVKFLYAVVAVLILAVGWQAWSNHRVYADLERDVAAQSFGAAAKDAKITMVAFMDYTCRVCKDVNPYLLQVVSENPDVRVIFHPLPQEREASQTAARFALAAAKQGKFVEMHEELMRTERPISEMTLRDIAEKLNLDYAQLKTDAMAADTTAEIARTLGLSIRLGIEYTPSFVINRKTVYVAMRPELAYGDFLHLIQQYRQ